MNNRAALLTAIDRNRDDDTVRLAYADWLMPTGWMNTARAIKMPRGSSGFG